MQKSSLGSRNGEILPDSIESGKEAKSNFGPKEKKLKHVPTQEQESVRTPEKAQRNRD
jgi:hypothetical protein